MTKIASLFAIFILAGCGADKPEKGDPIVITDDTTDMGAADMASGPTDMASNQDFGECGTCNVPLPACDGETVVSYDVACMSGTCVLGDPLRTDCAAGTMCTNGECVDPSDPCANRTCPRSFARCVGNMLEESDAAPMCNPANGACEGETFTRTDCASQNMICIQGACIPPRKRIFATVGRYTGDLATAGGGFDGPEGADNLCELEAAGASLGGTWKAWISTPFEDAIDRITDVGPWYLIDNQQRVANNLAQLVTQGPERNINILSDGSSLSGIGFQRGVWTGTRDNGRVTVAHCNGFTSESEDVIGWNGFNDNPPDWTEGIDNRCHLEFRLYCLEQ